LEQRSYFVAGDTLSNGLTGMAAAWLAVHTVDPSWPMPVAMLAGMVAGMGLSMVLMPLFVGLFGAMEVMLPVMLSAMLAGMAFGMAGAIYEPGTMLVLAGGGLTGILTLFLTYAADTGIRARNR
jgi:ABC-type enterobactin transport system permease subunit